MLEKFALKSLAEIDAGRLREAFDQALERALSDCRDRPAVGRARTVQLVVTLAPVMDDGTSQLESCDVSFDIKETYPKRSTRNYNMRATRAGLMFNEMAPEDARQGTLDEDPEWRQKKANG